MSKIIGFIKGNLVIVVSIVMILVFLPAGYIFSNNWNAKVYKEANAAYTGEKSTLTSKGKITYSLPAVLDGEADLSESRAPNDKVTKFYLAHKAQREQEVQEVVDRGTAFNQGEHVELVDGILPKAPNDLTLKRLGREMAEAIVGTESNPSVYQRKLARLNAGSPPEPEALASTLNGFKDREQQRYESSNADGKMTKPQGEQLDKDLVARRLGEYIGRSKALTFYCSTDAFVDSKTTKSSNTEYSVIPSAVPPLSTIDETTVFGWLWDYWVISDVLDAAALANTNPETGAMAIPDAPVKRIEEIRISKIPAIEASASTDDTSGQFAGRGGRSRGSSPVDVKAVDSSSTFTGRKGGQPESTYDIRTIRIVLVASSQDLPAFIDALAKTNYMTVTDLDIDSVDVWDDLENGFYFGDDHVVRATLSVESVWLRSWLEPIMPDQIKRALGIPVLVDDPKGSGG